MQMSSAMLAMCGRKSLISWPRLAVLAGTSNSGPRHLQLLALQLGDRLALGERLGHRLAVERGELRLVVEGFELRRPARHVEEDDALDPRPEVRAGRSIAARLAVPRRRPRATASRCGRAARRGRSSRARARRGPGRPGGSSNDVRRSWVWCIGSVPRDRLVEVQDRAGHRGPGGQLGGVERSAVGGLLADAQQPAGRGAVGRDTRAGASPAGRRGWRARPVRAVARGRVARPRSGGGRRRGRPPRRARSASARAAST